MPDDLISVIDLANQCGKRKQTIFKVLKRLGIEPKKLPRTSHRGQAVSYISGEEARLVLNHGLSKSLVEEPNDENSGLPHDALLDEQGVFYLLVLEPDHDPGRFKVGFATSLSERLRHLRCSAPLAKVVRTWPCKRLWERTAIECVAHGCERLHTEVFRTASLEAVLSKCDRFFELMPSLSGRGSSPPGPPAS
jgi:hypothetical protein